MLKENKQGDLISNIPGLWKLISWNRHNKIICPSGSNKSSYSQIITKKISRDLIFKYIIRKGIYKY